MYKHGDGSSASSAAPNAFRSHLKLISSPVTLHPNNILSPTKEEPVSTAESDSRSKTKDEPLTDNKITQSRSQLKEKPAKDLMISYSHADHEIMLKVRENLEKHGISVWVDVSGLSAGVDFLSKIGEAIIECKLFLSLLSSSSVKSKYCQDELALAYVSNRAIFPVALDDPVSLYPLMTTGMKLQLAAYEWSMLGKDSDKFNDNFSQVIALLKAELQRQDMEASRPSDITDQKPLVKNESRRKLNKRNTKVDFTSMEGLELLGPEEYWEKNFLLSENIPWSEFVQHFKTDFQEGLNKILKPEEQDWLFTVLKSEMEADENFVLQKLNFLTFCKVEGEYCPIWQRVKDQASESWSIKEVFDMNSSVRVDAIENLGKFRSPAVIDALCDLLSDQDANARAVAAISLARTNATDPVTAKSLMKILNDKDRLVREAGCLALGHLRVKQAVNKLLKLWRNDVISHVREAASVALNQIGGPEVEKAMRVTKVLADEIRQLTRS
ncbi:unnamed protein product [Lymnaea stagnalis]|uniref:TIR domain-containing protein n=1 Tax=Lymnaea stagnalis TaxID=6523 RepID=A0AAV2HPS8_LYMST